MRKFRMRSEGEFCLGMVTARDKKVGAAEIREEVVQGNCVPDIQDTKTQVQRIAIAAENVIEAASDVEYVARRESRRVAVVIFRAKPGDHDAGCAKVRGGAAVERVAQRGELTSAK